MQTAVSIIALLLSAASLTWQFATFALSGGRVKLELRAGAMDKAGNLVTAPLSEALQEGWLKHLVEQGYTLGVIAVRVRNTGRMPVTVEHWSLGKWTPEPASLIGRIESRINPPPQSGPELEPSGEATIGPPLPHLLEAGGPSATWAVRVEAVAAFGAATRAELGVDTLEVVGKVELGHGRTCTTPETFPLNTPRHAASGG